MKLQEIYNGLKDLAEKLGVCVKEENLKTAGLPVRSGLCRVRNRTLFIMNKHHGLSQKVELLSACIERLPHEEVYVMPALRDFLTARCSGGRPARMTDQGGGKTGLEDPAADRSE